MFQRGVIHRIYEIANRKPAKVFLMIGTNDLARGISADSLVNNILWIARYLKDQAPRQQGFLCKVFCRLTMRLESLQDILLKGQVILM
jgi:lysophospholipase L1-like esterase